MPAPNERAQIDPELARAYGLTRRGATPLPVVVATRFLGWIALSLWLGGLIAIEFCVHPAIHRSLEYAPMLVRSPDWQSRIEGYIVSGTLDSMGFIALGALLVLLIVTLREASDASGAGWLRWLPFAVLVILGVVGIVTANMRFDLATTSYAHYTRTLVLFTKLIDIQIVLLVLLAFCITFLQSKASTQPPEPELPEWF